MAIILHYSEPVNFVKEKTTFTKEKEIFHEPQRKHRYYVLVTRDSCLSHSKHNSFVLKTTASAQKRVGAFCCAQRLTMSTMEKDVI